MTAGQASSGGRDRDAVRTRLVETVGYLSETIGQRSYLDLDSLGRSADYIESRLRETGCPVKRQPFPYRGNIYHNISAEVAGTGDSGEKMLVVGAHYDTALYTPGADDNASGIAALLELAGMTARSPLKRPVRFVAFCLEEPPAYMTKSMGSYLYARSLREEGIPVLGMLSLEMLGYYADGNGTQYYPSSLFRPFYPDRGNFIAFVGNLSSRSFTLRLKKAFAAASSVPVESLSGISVIPGVDFSDHRNFWKFGFAACMVTDTAFYRNPHYHSPGDTADTLDYDTMAAVVQGLHHAFAGL